MRVEIVEIKNQKTISGYHIQGPWAWIIFGDEESVIAYSDGFRSRSACTSALKQHGLWNTIMKS